MGKILKLNDLWLVLHGIFRFEAQKTRVKKAVIGFWHLHTLFRRQTDQHEQTGKGAENGNRRAQQHAERQTPASVQRRQNQKHTKDGKREYNSRRKALVMVTSLVGVYSSGRKSG